MGQFKANTFRVVLTNNKPLNTSYKLNKKEKQIIIYTNSFKKQNNKNTIKKIKSKLIKNNKLIDKTNLIRSITSNKNQITINFNRKISKKYITYKKYKFKGNYENIFSIRSDFKYAKPTKLEINNIDKIITTTKNNKTIIKIRDKENNKIVYNIRPKTLIITFNIKSKDFFIQNQRINYRKNKVIVIDAGHGAKDSGAVGPHRRYEKVITLKTALKLRYFLKKMGYKVYLTRSNDKFIKVMNRTKLANKLDADIFLSIHANSVPRSKARKVQGIETFFLSPARSKRAKRVAARENKVDINKMNNSSKIAFLESLNRARITASHKLAIDIHAGALQSVKKIYSNVVDSGVREGPFWVLVGAQMPSILIELGYISHPKESARLYSNKYQQFLARGIANGIDAYFAKNP